MASDSLIYVSKTPWRGLISVSPERIEKQYQITREEEPLNFITVTITNETDEPVAWKIKTNRPERYNARYVTL